MLYSFMAFKEDFISNFKISDNRRGPKNAHIKDVFTLVSLKYVAMMMQFQRFYFWRRILVLGNLSVSGLHQILGSLSLR